MYCTVNLRLRSLILLKFKLKNMCNDYNLRLSYRYVHEINTYIFNMHTSTDTV